MDAFGEEFLRVNANEEGLGWVRLHIIHKAIERAIASARREQILWNPVLDRLVDSETGSAAGRIDQDLSEPLAAWMAAQADPARYRPLLMDEGADTLPRVVGASSSSGAGASGAPEAGASSASVVGAPSGRGIASFDTAVAPPGAAIASSRVSSASPHGVGHASGAAQKSPTSGGVRCRRLRLALFFEVPAVDEPMMQRALECGLEELRNWAVIPSLTPDQAARLLERGLRIWEQADYSDVPADPHHRETPASIVIHMLYRFGATPERTERLLALLAEQKRGSEELVAPLLKRTELLDSEQLETYWEVLSSGAPAMLAAHLALTEAQALRLAQESSGTVVHEALSQRADVLERPALLAHLAEHPSGKVLHLIAVGVHDPVLFRAIFVRYVKVRPNAAVRALVEGTVPDAALLHVEASDLLPAMTHSSPKVRLLAIQASARLAALVPPAPVPIAPPLHSGKEPCVDRHR
jgi:hypothetical protein